MKPVIWEEQRAADGTTIWRATAGGWRLVVAGGPVFWTWIASRPGRPADRGWDFPCGHELSLAAAQAKAEQAAVNNRNQNMV
jgi:hypothetical protein